MFAHCELLMLILALTLDGQVHMGEIFGGHTAVAHSRPYMVLLERHMQNGKTTYCDGFLLNEDFVMTAAHCHASNYTALFGVHNVLSNEILRVPVKQAFPHEDYDATIYKNDAMLLKLSSKVNFSKNVKPIPLADKSDASLPTSCMVSGWGSTNSEYMSRVLMEVNVTLVHNEQCAEENLYCSEGKTGPGNGDSGGPLVCEEGKAYGVVSFTVKLSSVDPQIYCYTKIPDIRNWIKSVIENTQ